jgi:hypothetical protein
MKDESILFLPEMRSFAKHHDILTILKLDNHKFQIMNSLEMLFEVLNDI